jgi:hypothetical protein
MTNVEKLLTDLIQEFKKVFSNTAVLSGRYGARTIGDTEERTGLTVYSISIREDATAFTGLVCTDDTTTLDHTFFLGGASATQAGDLYAAPQGYRFTEIELSGGSIQITGPNITGVVTPAP